ncbi:hypothetical protein SCUP515_08017 [Seiridium cupressi]
MSTNKRSFTPEQSREYKNRRLNKKRARAFLDILVDIPQDVDQEEWEESQQSVIESRSENCDPGGCPYESSIYTSTSEGQKIAVHEQLSHQAWAQIHSPSTSLVYDVQVIEDSGTGVNFIHPSWVENCDLQVYPTAPTVHRVMTGHQFRSDKWVQVDWLGKPGRVGSDWFYVAPEEAPIDLLVGRRFLKENQSAFPPEKLTPDSVLLNVESKKTDMEKAQIQANRAAAEAQAAALEKKRREKLQQRNADAKRGSSSRASNGSTFVEAVLHQAFVDGKQFDDIDQVEAFFKENGVHADFHSHSRDIFNIFLRVKARSRQTLTPDGSHLESAAGTDCGPDVSPAFTDEANLWRKDPFTISLYVPRYDGFRVASARRCRGKECFISKVTVELYNLEVRNQRTLLKWHRTGRSLVPFSQTWYQVAEPEIVDGCEVAIGEECATQDREHSESEADSEDAVTDELVASRSGDVGKDNVPESYHGYMQHANHGCNSPWDRGQWPVTAITNSRAGRLRADFSTAEHVLSHRAGQREEKGRDARLWPGIVIGFQKSQNQLPRVKCTGEQRQFLKVTECVA